jgi:ubiquinone/menaquinone biosynthesis C-methylase UbiE
MDKDFIKEHWEKQAVIYGDAHEASWGDYFAIDLEIQTIGQYISEGNEVLDIGCANGYSTFKQLSKKVRSITGIDFSEKMIEAANRKKLEMHLGDDVHFEVGDIRNLRLDDCSFDVVYTTRVLINLPTWEDQIMGIKECLRVCRNKGVVIFSEAFWEPLVLLNSFRVLKQLPPLIEHDFNRYLKKERLEEYLHSLNIEFVNVDFSSIYYLGSRFLREIVTNPQDYPGYSNPINEIFYKIEKEFSGGGFGIQQAYVLKK